MVPTRRCSRPVPDRLLSSHGDVATHDPKPAFQAVRPGPKSRAQRPACAWRGSPRRRVSEPNFCRRGFLTASSLVWKSLNTTAATSPCASRAWESAFGSPMARPVPGLPQRRLARVRASCSSRTRVEVCGVCGSVRNSGGPRSPRAKASRTAARNVNHHPGSSGCSPQSPRTWPTVTPSRPRHRPGTGSHVRQRRQAVRIHLQQPGRARGSSADDSTAHR